MDNAELEVKKNLCFHSKKNYVHLNSCRSINAKPFLVSFLVVSCLLSLGFNICHCPIYRVSTKRTPGWLFKGSLCSTLQEQEVAQGETYFLDWNLIMNSTYLGHSSEKKRLALKFST